MRTLSWFALFSKSARLYFSSIPWSLRPSVVAKLLSVLPRHFYKPPRVNFALHETNQCVGQTYSHTSPFLLWERTTFIAFRLFREASEIQQLVWLIFSRHFFRILKFKYLFGDFQFFQVGSNPEVALNWSALSLSTLERESFAFLRASAYVYPNILSAPILWFTPAYPGMGSPSFTSVTLLLTCSLGFLVAVEVFSSLIETLSLVLSVVSVACVLKEDFCILVKLRWLNDSIEVVASHSPKLPHGVRRNRLHDCELTFL